VRSVSTASADGRVKTGRERERGLGLPHQARYKSGRMGSSEQRGLPD